MIILSETQQIELIQQILGVTADGIWGPKSQAALDQITSTTPAPAHKTKHNTYASSFADPADIDAFNKCKAEGKSDQECFKVGDNGIGCWGDPTTQSTGPSCALPPEYMSARWGSTAAAKHKKIVVERTATKTRTACTLKDQMPSIKNLKNQAHIDLNPDACSALNLSPPIMEPVSWWWMADNIP